jgi:hypothetical protein
MYRTPACAPAFVIPYAASDSAETLDASSPCARYEPPISAAAALR